MFQTTMGGDKEGCTSPAVNTFLAFSNLGEGENKRAEETLHLERPPLAATLASGLSTWRSEPSGSFQKKQSNLCLN